MLIVRYDPNWIKDFKQIASTLSRTLNGIISGTEHVGSTAIPNLASKAIIDIDIIYHEQENFELIKKRLESIGYIHSVNQGIKDREVFKRNLIQMDPILGQISHHLYVCKNNSIELQRHLLFRDYLKSNNTAKEFYQNLKYELALEAKDDRKVYAHLKELKANSFINYIIELARKS